MADYSKNFLNSMTGYVPVDNVDGDPESTPAPKKFNPTDTTNTSLSSKPLPDNLKTGEPKFIPKANTAKIPLPNYNDPKSRLNYASQFVKKYGPMLAQRGDTVLHINDVPDTGVDKISAKQMAINAAKEQGLDEALLYSSASEEGLSGLFKGASAIDRRSGNPDFPVSGQAGFGLDTFADNFPALVKKGYLTKDFTKKFTPRQFQNEKGEVVNSADFTTAEDAMKAKAAMIKISEDEVSEYAKKNNINLSPQAKKFFTLVSYNGGSGVGLPMIKDYNNNGYLKDDAFFKKRPTSGKGLKESSYKQPYENVMRRFVMADALRKEGYFDQPKKPVNNTGVASK